MQLRFAPGTTLLLAFIILMAACASEPQGPTWPPPPREHPPEPDIRGVVPPLTEKDAIRVWIAHDGDAKHSVLEGGSWAALAMVRLANRLDRTGCLISPNAPRRCGVASPVLAERLATIWMGADGEPWTRDDRPFPDLHTLLKRGGLSPDELGTLVQAARANPPLPRDPGRWILTEGVVLTRYEARHLLTTANTCSVNALHEAVNLPKRARESLAAQRPFHELGALAAAPGVDRRLLARLLHHAPACSTSPAPPSIDAIELLVEAHPQARHLSWILPPDRFDGLVEKLRHQPEPNASLEQEVAQRSEQLFHERPTPHPRSDDDRELRATAAALIADWLTRQGAMRDHWGAMARDLGALRRLEEGWEVVDQEGAWVARGWCLGVRFEVRHQLGAGEAMQLQAWQTRKTNPLRSSSPRGFD